MILVRASGTGIKREGLLYFEKYGTGGPEFGIKEEICNRKGKAALSNAPCMNREACCLQLGQLTDAN